MVNAEHHVHFGMSKVIHVLKEVGDIAIEILL
jgi:hypothetical protein